MAGKDHQLNIHRTLFVSIESIYWVLIIASLFCFGLGILNEELILILIPFLFISGAITALNFHWIYYLFFALLPFSVEVYLPNGFGTDLPTEPIMILLTGVFLVKMVERFATLKKQKWLHPISVILIIHLLWIFFISMFSVDSFVSVKFALAKSWYILPFYFLTLFIIEKRDNQKIKTIIKTLWWSLSIAMVYIMVRHAAEGFSFASINDALKPIFRNHVNYAVLLVAIMPYLWFLFRHSDKKKIYGSSILFLLVAIYLSYTRAAHACVFLGIIVYFIVKFRLMKYGLIAAGIAVTLFIGNVIHENKYLAYAPDYTKAVAHYKFDNLMEATTKLEDISTMERVYRWVAGFHMVADRPLTGFGPGSFYPTYKDYTVRLFRTYVSDNPEKSGMHNAFLMVFVEQGIIGFLIMLLICVLPLLYGEYYYHNLADPIDKAIVMAATISVSIVCAVLVINELLEADKIGPLFFLSLAIISSKSGKLLSLDQK